MDKWKAVLNHPRYKKMSIAEKEDVINNFYRIEIQPHVEKGKEKQMLNRFKTDAFLDSGVKMSDMPHFKKNLAEAQRGAQDYAQEQNDYDTSEDYYDDPEDRKAMAQFAIDEAEEKRNRGRLTQAFMAGADNSVLGKTINRLAEEESDHFQTNGFLENLVHGIGGIAADMPLMLTGGGIVGKLVPGALKATSVGRAVMAGGSFAPVGAGHEAHQVLDEGGEISDNLRRIAGAGGLSFATGAASSGLGSLAGGLVGFGAKKLIGETAGKVAKETATLLGEEAGMTLSDHLQGREITGETIGTNLGMAIMMRALSHSPGSRKKLEEVKKNTGMSEREILEKVDVPEGKIDEPYVLEQALEKVNKDALVDIEKRKINHLQNQIIDNQIKNNYKPGKTVEQTIQIAQIPKEHRALLFNIDQTTGKAVFKPEVVESFNRKMNPFFNPADDVPFKSRGEILKEKDQRLKQDQDYSKEKLKHLEEEYDNRVHQEVREYMDKRFGRRRFPNAGKARDTMDQVIDYIRSTTTPEEQFRLVHNGDVLTYIDVVESGFDKLKPKYQQAVLNEVREVLAQEMNYTPQDLISKAFKHGRRKVEAEINRERKKIKRIAQQSKKITKDPDFIEHIKQEEFNSLPPEKKAEMLSKEVQKTEAIYEAERLKQEEIIRQEIQPEMMKIMGDHESFGSLSKNAEEYYGYSHVEDTREFYRKPDEVAVAEFNNFGLLEKEIKGYSFQNTSRVIERVLGKRAYELIVEPVRQHEHNYGYEFADFKKYWTNKKREHKYTKKERKRAGTAMIAMNENGLETLFAMNERYELAPWYKKPFKKKVDIIKYEELSPKERALCDEIKQLMDVTYERINASREFSGLEPLPRTENYFTFIRKFTLMEEAGFAPGVISAQEFTALGGEDVHMHHVANRFEKERTWSTRDLETDAFYVVEKYMKNALRSIHMTPVLTRLQKWNNDITFQYNNYHAHKFLQDFLDYSMGKKLSDFKLNPVLNYLNNSIPAFVLSFNVQSMFVQPSALVNAYAYTGGKYMYEGVKAFTKKSKRDFARKASKVLASRVFDVSLTRQGRVGKTKEKLTDIGTSGLRYLDQQTATIAWLGAYEKAIAGHDLPRKMTSKEAIKYADNMVVKTQGSASKTDLAPIQRTPGGKFLTLFNTFSINQFNSFIDDMAGLRKGNIKTKTLTKEQQIEFSKELNRNPELAKKTILMQKKDRNGNFIEEYDVYEKIDHVSKSEGRKRILRFMAGATVANTIMELTNFNSPFSAPLSALCKAQTGMEWPELFVGSNLTEDEAKDVNTLAVLMAEVVQMVPVVGGSLKYGSGSTAGAGMGLIFETIEAFSPGARNSKSLLYVAGKWAGFPGGGQISKIIRRFAKRQKELEDLRDYKKQYRKMMRNLPYNKMKRQIRKDMRAI